MKKWISSLLLTSFLASGTLVAADNPTFGIVNFATCISDSKLGKQEQASFESLRTQTTALLEQTEKQMNEIATKLNDPEFVDGLSPEAEEELKVKFRTLNDDLGRYQNQYYQVLNQANMRLVQILSSGITAASEKVAKDKKLTMVINKEACFFYSPQLDVTPLVINQMNQTFEESAKAPQTKVARQSKPHRYRCGSSR